MKRQSFFFIFLGAIIAVISILLFVVQEPERLSIQSDDGVLTIDGLAREDQDVHVEVLGNYLYQVNPTGSSFIEPLTLSFDVSQAQFDFDIAVYKYNEDMLMWEAISAAIDPSVQQIVLEQNALGTYTIKEYAMIDVPDFVSTQEELLAMAPAGTVGYEIGLGFIAADGSVIRISEKTQLGGCGGVVESGQSVEMSQVERTTRVYVGDVEQSVKFLFVGRWYVSNNGGCVDGLDLEPSREL